MHASRSLGILSTCLVLALGTIPLSSAIEICSSYVLPVTTVLKGYDLGSKDLIRRACWDNTEKYVQLLDVDPKDGTADGFDNEDFTARAYNMIFEAMVKYQRDLCTKNPSSEYCCKKGVQEVDALNKRSCWLKQGQSTYLNGKPFTARISTSREGFGDGLHKVAYVWSYICNGEQDSKNVSIIYDLEYRRGCATPEQVWKKSFFE